MSNSLRSQLSDLATSFADAVLAAARSASLAELLEAPRAHASTPRGNGMAASKLPPTGQSSGRLPRRSTEEIASTLENVVRLVKGHKNGLRAEQIRQELGMRPKEMPRILKEGLSTKKLKAKEQKRATTYLAA